MAAARLIALQRVCAGVFIICLGAYAFDIHQAAAVRRQQVDVQHGVLQGPRLEYLVVLYCVRHELSTLIRQDHLN